MRQGSRFAAASAAFMALVLFAVSANLVPTCQLRISSSFSVAVVSVAQAFSFQFAGFFAACVAGGALADRLGKRPVLLAGCVLLAAGALMWVFAGGLAYGYAAAVVMGLGGGILESMSSALLADLFPLRTGFALNMSQVGYGAGAVLGPAFIGVLLPMGISWRVFFGATAVCSVAVFAGFAWTRMPERKRSEPLPGPASHERVPSARAGALLSLTFAAPCAAIFLYVLSEMGLVAFMTPYLCQRLGAPERWAILAVAGFWAAMTLGRIGCAFLPETERGEGVIAVLMALAGAVVLAQVLVRETWPLAAGLFALAAFAMAGTWPLIVSLVARRYAHVSGMAVGVTVATGSLGCIAAPPLFGVLAEGRVQGGLFAAMAGSLFAGAAIMMWLRRVKQFPAAAAAEVIAYDNA